MITGHAQNDRGSNMYTHSFCRFVSDVNRPADRDVIPFEDRSL